MGTVRKEDEGGAILDREDEDCIRISSKQKEAFERSTCDKGKNPGWYTYPENENIVIYWKITGIFSLPHHFQNN